MNLKLLQRMRCMCHIAISICGVDASPVVDLQLITSGAAKRHGYYGTTL